jgi:hypothetical protein
VTFLLLLEKWFEYLEKNWVGITLTQSFVLTLSALFGFWDQGLATHNWQIYTLWPGVTAVMGAGTMAYASFFTKQNLQLKRETLQRKEDTSNGN